MHCSHPIVRSSLMILLTSSSWCRAKTVPRNCWHTSVIWRSMEAPSKAKPLVLIILLSLSFNGKIRENPASKPTLSSPSFKVAKTRLMVLPWTLPCLARSDGATLSLKKVPKHLPKQCANTQAPSLWIPHGVTPTNLSLRLVCEL